MIKGQSKQLRIPKSHDITIIVLASLQSNHFHTYSPGINPLSFPKPPIQPNKYSKSTLIAGIVKNSISKDKGYILDKDMRKTLLTCNISDIYSARLIHWLLVFP